MHAVIYIVGVSGSGKTTIGKLLSVKTGLPFFDADDFHSAGNKEKMKAGQPLTDEDRQQWLQQLNSVAIEQSKLKGAIIACSALKEKYRIVLAHNISQPIWIFLQGSYELIYERMKQRNHFMPAQLLQSQFSDLEMPASAFTIDIKNDPEKIIEMIMQYLKDTVH
jgi:carbohydrate kinase, thermoresistant glucokinase family